MSDICPPSPSLYASRSDDPSKHADLPSFDLQPSFSVGIPRRMPQWHRKYSQPSVLLFILYLWRNEFFLSRFQSMSNRIKGQKQYTIRRRACWCKTPSAYAPDHIIGSSCSHKLLDSSLCSCAELWDSTCSLCPTDPAQSGHTSSLLSISPALNLNRNPSATP